MTFAPIKFQEIKAISQRTLAAYWLDLASKGGLPRFDDFKPSERMHDPKRMLVWAVDGPDAGRAFNPIYGGDYYVEAFGKEFDPDTGAAEPLRSTIFDGLNACAEMRSLIYMIIVSADAEGRQIDCERLLIPFGNGGDTVSHIMANVEVISIEGTFQRASVFHQFNARSEVVLCGMIPGPF